MNRKSPYLVFPLVLTMFCICKAAGISVENHSFEFPPGGKQSLVVPTYWTVDGSDFGIEALATDGSQCAYLGKNSSLYQTLDHTIAEGDQYLLTFDAIKTWPQSGIVNYEGWLYYDDNGTAVEITSIAGSDSDRSWDEYQLTYTVQPADPFIGEKLGVLFISTSTYSQGIRAGFDNVRLDFINFFFATNPMPADGQSNLLKDLTLAWTPGINADSQDIYIGTDFDDVNDANNTWPIGTSVYKANISADINTYDPCEIQFSTTYYWRIDQVNGPDLWRGDIWWFTLRLAADFDANGIVNFDDLAIMTSDWLNTGPDVIADAYEDGNVDFKDYAVLTGTWHRGYYYIDSENGDDSNPGTSPNEPWQSLDPVNAQTFFPGDRIFFKAGTTYTGQLKPQGSGSAAKPIIIDMYGEGTKPRIDGEGDVLDTLLLENVEYWEVNNLEITNLGPTRVNWRTGVRVSANGSGTLHHIHLKNLYVHDVNGSLDKSTEGCGIFWECKGTELSRFDDLLIQDCHVVRTDRNGICGRSTFTDHSSNWFPSLNVVIRGNLLEDIGGDCIKPWGCDGCLVEFNTVHGGRQRCEDYAAGIWPWSCDDTVIQFNEVSHVKGTKDGQGFDSDYNCQNSLFQYNYSHDNDGGFILICGPSPSSSNIGTLGTVVRYNISQDDAERTFHISGGGVQNTLIYNNVIYVEPALDIPLVLFGSWDGWPDDSQFYNNIFYADGTLRYAYALSRNDDGTYNYASGFGSATNIVFSNNVYYGNHVDPPYDPNAITADPMLDAPGSGADGTDTLTGYMLTTGSPCIDAGVYIPDNGGFDFWQNPLPDMSVPDVGAHQYSD